MKAWLSNLKSEIAGRLSSSARQPSSFHSSEGTDEVKDDLSHVDLCFVVDTTGSMSPFIGAAREALLDTVEALGARSGVDLRVGLVEYRDHPPQDYSFVTRLHALTADLKQLRKVIAGLKADGGGDHPEAVYDGVRDAAARTEWREHSCRFIMLVGDAPPHGYVPPAAAPVPERGAGRGARRRGAVGAGAARSTCTCGLDAAQVTAAAESSRVTVHALPMTDDAQTVGAFTEIARGTGGECAAATDAARVVGRIGEMLDAEFRNLLFDREALAAAERLASLDAGELGRQLGCTRLQAAAAIARLGRRGFLRDFAGAGLTPAQM